MKVSRGQKVPLVTAASHLVISWLLLLDFKHRYGFSGYRLEIANSFRPFIYIMDFHFVSSVFHIVSSFRLCV